MPISGGPGSEVETSLASIDSKLSSPVEVVSNNELYSSFSPDPTTVSLGNFPAAMDGRRRLETHSTVLTDEGSFRDDFSGTSLNTTITGTITFTNGTSSLTGSGTSFTTQIKNGQYIKKTTDAETLWVRVSEVLSDTSLELEESYTGTTASVAAHVSNWKTTTGTGSLSVLNSLMTIGSGTAIGTTNVNRDADYGPFNVNFKFSISQRIANQTITIGTQTPIVAPTRRCVFQFTGTDNTQVSCVTSSSADAADIQTTTVTLPNNKTTATSLEYAINVSSDQISFLVDKVVVAQHRDHIFGAYDFMETVFQQVNAAVVTNTNLIVDWHDFYNINQLEITNNSKGEPLGIAPVEIKDRSIATYSAGTAPLTAANTATDIFTITGSASKVVRIRKMGFAASATNPTSANILIVKRSTANTGGTSTLLTNVPNDSDDLAGTATVRSYTANPTLGTTIGNIRSYKMTIPQTTPLGGVGGGPINEITFGNIGDKAIVLRGTSEVLSVNLNSTTITGNSFNIFVEWTEEDS